MGCVLCIPSYTHCVSALCRSVRVSLSSICLAVSRGSIWPTALCFRPHPGPACGARQTDPPTRSTALTGASRGRPVQEAQAHRKRTAHDTTHTARAQRTARRAGTGAAVRADRRAHAPRPAGLCVLLSGAIHSFVTAVHGEGTGVEAGRPSAGARRKAAVESRTIRGSVVHEHLTVIYTGATDAQPCTPTAPRCAGHDGCSPRCGASLQ